MALLGITPELELEDELLDDDEEVELLDELLELLVEEELLDDGSPPPPQLQRSRAKNTQKAEIVHFVARNKVSI